MSTEDMRLFSEIDTLKRGRLRWLEAENRQLREALEELAQYPIEPDWRGRVRSYVPEQMRRVAANAITRANKFVKR